MYQTICTWTHERHSLSIVIWILYIQNSQIKCMIFKKSIMSNQCVKCKFLSSNHSPISPKKLNSLHITEWSLSGNILGGVYVGFTSTANQKIIPFTSKPSQKTCPVYSWACAVQGDSISVLEVNYEAVFCTEGGGQGKGWRAVWTTCCCHIQWWAMMTAKYYKYYYFVCSDQEVQICSCEVYILIYHPLFDCLQYKNWKVRRRRVEISYIVKYLFCA